MALNDNHIHIYMKQQTCSDLLLNICSFDQSVFKGYSFGNMMKAIVFQGRNWKLPDDTSPDLINSSVFNQMHLCESLLLFICFPSQMLLFFLLYISWTECQSLKYMQRWKRCSLSRCILALKCKTKPWHLRFHRQSSLTINPKNTDCLLVFCHATMTERNAKY